MDEQNFKDLAYRAWVLYKRLDEMMLQLDDIFWSEFGCLSAAEAQNREQKEQTTLQF